MSQKFLIVFGRVLDPANLHNIAGLRVEAQSNGVSANAVTDARGAFTLTFDQSRDPNLFIGNSPDVIFTFNVFDGETLINTTQKAVPRDSEGGRFEIEIELTPNVEPKPFVVRGQVRQDGHPLSGILIAAVDKDLRSEELLGQAMTDEQGRYEIAYTAAQFSRAEKGSADLIVRAQDSAGNLLAASPIIFNAPPVATVDLVVGNGNARGPSEYEQLLAVITPLLDGLSPAELVEDAQHQDITFLAIETGRDRRHIEFFAAAHRLAQQTGLPPDAFYGLFRQNLPTELRALVAQPPQVQRRALQAAILGNIIPPMRDAELDQIVQRLGEIEVAQPAFLFQPEVLFGDLTDIGRLPTDQAEFIATQLNEHLRREIFTVIGPVSEAMTRAMYAASSRLDYRNFKDAELSAIIISVILAASKSNGNLAAEAAAVEERLAALPARPVSDLLHLALPLQENPIFAAEVRRVKTLAYAGLAGLDNGTARKLVQKNLLLDDVNEATLAALVTEGILRDEQKPGLRLAIELGKLTGDNLPFIRILQARALTSVVDVISLEKADWQQLIVAERLPLHHGETVESYADNILFNIERTYPSQFLLSRLLSPKLTTQFNLLDSLNPLLEGNNKLIEGETPADINWGALDAESREKLQVDLQSLTAFANTYRNLGIAPLINDKTLDLNQKKRAIDARLQLLSTFSINNRGTDLRLVNFFDTQETSLDWSGIPVADRPSVRKQAMAYQRMLTIADASADRQMLLSKGYDSATAITAKTEAEFLSTSGLPLGPARMTYAKAYESALLVSHHFEALRDTVRGGFGDIAVSNLDRTLVNDLREIDGFDDLFGAQDFCACEECRSILSPAAYFVDLMYFIEQHVSKAVFIKAKKTAHALYLKNRRGDLWTLQVTCENTHTLIPYLTIVNEVLETYLKTVVSGDVFEKLSKQAEKSSFCLPFNLPLEEVGVYLGHFGITLHDIYRILKQPEAKTWRAKLNLSEDEFGIITTPDPLGVKFRFGNPASFSDFPVHDIKDASQDRRGFIQLAGISRSQLDELFALTFHPDLKNITVGKKVTVGELQNFPEILKNLTDSRLDFIHRFIRLWRKTAWSIAELDLVLTAWQQADPTSSDLNRPAVLELAQLVDLQENLKLSVEELCSMVDQLPASQEFPQPPAHQGDRKLFERLFDVKQLFGTTEAAGVEPSLTFHHYSLNTKDPTDKTIDPKTPILLGGLGVSETELLLLFGLLKDEMPFNTDGDCTLDRKKISLLYRHARLARALKLTIEDFIQTLRLLSVPKELVVKTLAQIQQLIQFRDWLKSSPFSVSDLRFILKGEVSNTVTYKTTPELVEAMVLEIQNTPGFITLTASEKVDALKAHLSKLFNLSSKQLDDTLKWVATDIKSPGIQTALNTAFNKDTTPKPFKPDELTVLRDNLVKQIERILLLFGNLKFEAKTIAYLTQKSALLGIADRTLLTLDNIKALTFYKALLALSEEAEETVQNVLDTFTPTLDTAALANLWQQDKNLIASLTNSLSLPTVPIAALQYLWECLNLCLTLGINGFSLQKLAADADFAELSAARDVALGAFSSKYDDDKIRHEKLEPYQDRINVKKRDALCNYIIAKQIDLKFKDLHDIYAFFLLDVEMSGCFRTSRLVCAISSLQFYVHRVLMNLEQAASGKLVVLSEVKDLVPFQQEWEWRQNYRVWEANRKVFLYPENYIEPDLRDNKTPIFKELEDELLQQKITKESAEAAYKKYVSQFAELARLRIAGSYYYEDEDKDKPAKTKTYYFFGRTQQDPPQYYYRKWIDNTVWTPWEKIELGINADRVSAIVHLGKLYLFWVEAKTKEKYSDFKDGESKFLHYEHEIDVLYSFVTEYGKWIAPQRLKLLPPSKDLLWITSEDYNNNYFEKTKVYKRVYLKRDNNRIIANYLIALGSPSPVLKGGLDLFHNELIVTKSAPSLSLIEGRYLKLCKKSGKATFVSSSYSVDSEPEEELHSIQVEDASIFPARLTNDFDDKFYQCDIDIVQNKRGDYIIKIDNQEFLVKALSTGKIIFILGKRVAVRIGTSLADEFGTILFTKGLESFLARGTQELTEKNPAGVFFTNPSELYPPLDDATHIDFKGSYGEYYRELFFHIPFLIANHLNANQKFKEAKWWYERIFDPTTSEPPDPAKPTDRHWQYIEFRDVTLQKMKDILTDKAAIEQYKKDPFNPHAIARLRLSAYQKAIVMKYIDNLLDWGDDLFAQDSMESINEATMLYVLASDILGKRPVELGKCETARDEELTYEKIGPAMDKGKGSEFLITLENWSWVSSVTAEIDKYKFEIPLGFTASAARAAAPATLPYVLSSYTASVEEKGRYLVVTKDWESATSIPKYPGRSMVKQSTQVFCVPPNYNLLQYWDRVEDRLFKIRHCMNISGVRRQLALFQPSIDPMALVRAKAAGLSLEDILSLVDKQIPPYRFSYLIEKAKQFTQTVQSFGSALLSALEKKDVEELTLLRSVHERNILRMTKAIKKQQVREAQHQYQAIVETQVNVQNRINYYQGLIDEGLTKWEVTQQVSKHIGTGLLALETVLRLTASISYLVPQVGSPLAMKYGGKEIGDSQLAFSDLMANLSRISDAISASAGLQATDQRREQEWKQQLLLAQQELKQVERQRLAADIRQLIAEKDLEIHEKNMDQADELHEFYKNKFTNLGLYNYLSTTLNRLYREAYNVAYDMANMAARTYQFERDDDTPFIAGDNWQFDRAGLLAGERLLLQLQRMEKAYLEQHKRDYEVTQLFSLALLDPSALMGLKQTGGCEFTLPEIMFDLFYPGQYKRLIKSVRITIPCVTGPYTNVSAKLTLLNSWARRSDKLNTTPLDAVGDHLRVAQNTSISASSGQNDAGMFELNFRDERYLPFEGAGAISTWGLELPSKLRAFNYDTISDVIIHLSYTAKDDGEFRSSVEDNIAATLTSVATDPARGLFRLFSLKHEFPNAFHQLLHPAGTTQTTEFELSKQHFPYFLADKDLILVSPVKLYLKPKGKDRVTKIGPTIKVNNKAIVSWIDFAENLKEGTVTILGNPITKWSINAGANGLDPEKLDDILILLRYRI